MAADVILHKGMSRVIIPTGFSEKISPSNAVPSVQPLIAKEKEWIKGVNTIELMRSIPANISGIECDVYFDDNKEIFEVYHDSSAPSTLNLDTLLNIYLQRNLSASIWLDFKNLNNENVQLSLKEVNRLKNKYHLDNYIIIESHSAENLVTYNKNGFFTSFYIPFFNPYQVSEDSLVRMVNYIKAQIETYPASALSGYYFQYPVLKKFFPSYPLLTWSTRSFSLVSYTFNSQLRSDEQIKVILYPFEK
jgi:heptose-I-phosphate ethanolaminephosphotransferase